MSHCQYARVRARRSSKHQHLYDQSFGNEVAIRAELGPASPSQDLGRPVLNLKVLPMIASVHTDGADALTFMEFSARLRICGFLFRLSSSFCFFSASHSSSVFIFGASTCKMGSQ